MSAQRAAILQLKKLYLDQVGFYCSMHDGVVMYPSNTYTISTQLSENDSTSSYYYVEYGSRPVPQLVCDMSRYGRLAHECIPHESIQIDPGTQHSLDDCLASLLLLYLTSICRCI